MYYLSLLGDYSNILADILADLPLPAKSSLSEFVLRHAKHYKDDSLSYPLLANNLYYVVSKVRTSNIKYLLGDEWLTKHEIKVKQFALNYEWIAWSRIIGSLPEDPTAVTSPEEVNEVFKRFNSLFDQSYKRQSVCVVPDSKLRDKIKVSIARKLVGVYQEFYGARSLVIERERNLALEVKYTPEDVWNYLSY
ncbi:unnamed protein product [Ilex paraguariensis]|uniref:Exocyst subunit Exo70 family protein n=1 Tax=Ilex paraguariensis TaxID=185542 RepID=A0ABC8V6C4_9AQUA